MFEEESMIRTRGDLAFLMIFLESFQPFDRGEEIETNVPVGWKLLPGDRIFWECAQFDGLAEVIRCKNLEEAHTVCVIKKIS